MSGSADAGSGPCHTVTAEETVLWLAGPALLWLALSLPPFFFLFLRLLSLLPLLSRSFLPFAMILHLRSLGPHLSIFADDIFLALPDTFIIF